MRGVEALRQRNQQSAQTSTDGVPIVAEADPTCLELLDHPRVLPYVVDAMGWNIHARDCLFTAQPPRSGAALSAAFITALAVPLGSTHVVIRVFTL